MITNRIRETDLAALLHAIAARPNARKEPRAGDLPGDYDEWFDGGAVRVDTGVTTYVFANGVVARTASTPHLLVDVQFPDGRVVSIVQR